MLLLAYSRINEVTHREYGLTSIRLVDYRDILHHSFGYRLGSLTISQ